MYLSICYLEYDTVLLKKNVIDTSALTADIKEFIFNGRWCSLEVGTLIPSWLLPLRDRVKVV